MIDGAISLQLRYSCPCAAGEVLQVTCSCFLRDGEEVFMRRARHLYRQALAEIKEHEDKEKAAEISPDMS